MPHAVDKLLIWSLFTLALAVPNLGLCLVLALILIHRRQAVKTNHFID
jgi:hypothetical protein